MSRPTARRVLVVDDEPAILAAVRLNLSRHGLAVATAATGSKRFMTGNSFPRGSMMSGYYLTIGRKRDAAHMCGQSGASSSSRSGPWARVGRGP